MAVFEAKLRIIGHLLHWALYIVFTIFKIVTFPLTDTMCSHFTHPVFFANCVPHCTDDGLCDGTVGRGI